MRRWRRWPITRWCSELRSGTGLMAGVQLEADVPGRGVAHCIEAGVLVRMITDNTVQISPPFVVTEAELAKIGAVLFDALEHVDPRVQASAA